MLPQRSVLQMYDQVLGKAADPMLAAMCRATPKTMGILMPRNAVDNRLFVRAIGRASEAKCMERVSLQYHQECLRNHLHDPIGDIHLLVARHIELFSLSSGASGQQNQPLGPVTCQADAVAVIGLMRKLFVHKVFQSQNNLVVCDVEHAVSKRKGQMFFQLVTGPTKTPNDLSLLDVELTDDDYGAFGSSVFELVHGAKPGRTIFYQCVSQTLKMLGGNVDAKQENAVERAVALSAWGSGSPNDIAARAKCLVEGSPMPSPVGTCVHWSDKVLAQFQ